MNVLGITNFYSSLDPLCPQAIQKPMQILTDHGCDIRIISPIPYTNKWLSKKWDQISKLPFKRKESDVIVYHPRYLEIPRNFFKSTAGLRYYLAIKRAYSKFASFKPEVIHAHMCYPDGYTAMRISKQYKIPYVVTVRGTDLLTLKSYPRVRSYLFETLKKATRVIVPSERIKSQLGNFFPQIRSIVIPNGIDIGEFEYLNSIQMSDLEGKKIIVSVCNLNKDKGIEINVRAVAEVIKTRQDFHYIIVGDGAEGENLRSIVNELRLNSFVTFVGKQSHVKALEYINKSDVFSLPSWNETFGLVYLEAMYLKKPIVATFNDGIDGAALDGVHGYFAHKQNVPEVAEALKRLLSSEQLRIEMGSKGHEEVLKNYTWQKIAEKISKIYQEVINE